jgi:redox-sensitive bicupin YhaK (pirin superfamily)
MGHEQVLGPNEIQRMSAGTGVLHSEFNASKTEPLHFFQIWIEPATQGIEPSYEQLRFDPAEKQNKLKLLAGPQPGNGAAQINQDAQVYVAELTKGSAIPYALGKERAVWVHVVDGEIDVNGLALKKGDAAAVTGEDLVLTATGSGVNEVLLFDVK